MKSLAKQTNPAELIAHILNVTFGMYSTVNVHAFLVNGGHGYVQAWILSIGLGAILITLAAMISKIDRRSERSAWAWTLSIALAFGVLSGAMQTSVYLHEGLTLPWAVGLGFVVPVLGEIMFSLIIAMFGGVMHRKALREVNAKVEAAVVASINEAVNDFDAAAIKRRVQRGLDEVAKRAVDGTFANLMSYYGEVSEVELPKGEYSFHPASENPSLSGGEIMHDFTSADELAAARSEKAQGRKGKFFTLVQRGDLSVGEIAGELGVTDRTVKSYIADLREQGIDVYVNGVVRLN